MRILLALDEQIQRIQNRQTGLDQRQKLLVINQKRTLLQLAPAACSEAARQQTLRLYPMNQIPLRGKAIAHLIHRVSLLDLLVGVPTLVREFYDKFRHVPVLFSPGLTHYLLGSV